MSTRQYCYVLYRNFRYLDGGGTHSSSIRLRRVAGISVACTYRRSNTQMRCAKGKPLFCHRNEGVAVWNTMRPERWQKTRQSAEAETEKQTNLA